MKNKEKKNFGWKEFFKLTIVKIVLTIITLILIGFPLVGFPNCVDCGSGFIIFKGIIGQNISIPVPQSLDSLTSFIYIITIIIEIILSYLISCIIMFLFNKIKKKKR